MHRFYFHLHNGMDVVDSEGEELPHLEAAIAHAKELARSELAQLARERGRIVLSHRIDIEDAQGVVLGTVRFGDAVEVDD